MPIKPPFDIGKSIKYVKRGEDDRLMSVISGLASADVRKARELTPSAISCSLDQMIVIHGHHRYLRAGDSNVKFNLFIDQ